LRKLKVHRERHFSPHHALLGAAWIALGDAKEKRHGWKRYELMAITFSALALEAIANAFGARLVPRWEKDFEKCPPTAKLRTVCMQLGIDVDFDREPWQTALWLIKFRNNVAHAKPQFIDEKKIVSDQEYDMIKDVFPISNLEDQVSLPNAERAVKEASSILHLLCKQLPIEQQQGLMADGWSGTTTIVDE